MLDVSSSLLFFIGGVKKAVDFDTTYQCRRTYIKAEICQSEFTHQLTEKAHAQLNSTSVSEDAINSMVNNDNNNSKMVDTDTPNTFMFNDTQNSTIHEACTFRTDVIDMVANVGMNTDDQIKTCRNRKSSKPVSSKRLKDKKNLLYQKKKATQIKNSITPLTGQQLIGQRSQKRKRENTISTSFQCDRCQKQFKRKSHLFSHQVYVHNKSSDHQCIKCDKYLPTASHLKDHMSFHEGIRNHRCQLCQEKFCRKGDLNVHMRTHSDETPFKCELCQHNFVKRSKLQAHIRVHTGEKPFICRICNKAFTQNGSLKVHMKTHNFKKP